MTLTIELTSEQEARLQAAAVQCGVDPAEYAKQVLNENLPSLPVTGAEALAYWKREGARGVYADRHRYPEDSPELARKLRQKEEARGRG